MKFYNLGHKTFETDFRLIVRHEQQSIFIADKKTFNLKAGQGERM